MTTIAQYLQYAETALAAYAGALTSAGGESNNSSYRTAGMTQQEATRFDQSWIVLSQAPDAPNGVSAVLLQNRTTGEKVLAVRRTEPSQGGIDYFTDIVNIAALGTVAGMAQYQAFEAFYEELITSGKLISTEQVTVTGHSLGLIVGIGVGLDLSSPAMGVSLDERASRTEEYLEALGPRCGRRTPSSSTDSTLDFAGVDANPRPVQSGGPPILIGGNSESRAGGRSRAPTVWIPGTTSISTRALVRPVSPRLTATCRTYPRGPDWLGAFDFTIISPNNRLDPEHVEVYRELGVDRLICLPGLWTWPRDRRSPRHVGRRHLQEQVDLHLAELARDWIDASPSRT